MCRHAHFRHTFLSEKRDTRFRFVLDFAFILCYNSFMNDLDLRNKKLFEDIRHFDENGVEFWFARELQHVLQYAKWENFHKVIRTAQIACKISQQQVSNHFPEVRKMVSIGSNTTRSLIDYKLTRYACYLIVMNGVRVRMLLHRDRLILR